MGARGFISYRAAAGVTEIALIVICEKCFKALTLDRSVQRLERIQSRWFFVEGILTND